MVKYRYFSESPIFHRNRIDMLGTYTIRGGKKKTIGQKLKPEVTKVLDSSNFSLTS